ncbi:MAG: hypothetical protein L3J47_00180 [Sulfurovum sp.]|nr:hypothetical protein [Sulfurovum sp.]
MKSNKPDPTYLKTPTINYIARASSYGDYLYQRADYLKPTNSIKEDFVRLRACLGAALRHLTKACDAMDKHQATDLLLEDENGLKRAAYAADTDYSTSHVASLLPHVAHAVSRLNIGIAQAAWSGLMPEDPGTPWEDQEVCVATSEDPSNSYASIDSEVEDGELLARSSLAGLVARIYSVSPRELVVRLPEINGCLQMHLQYKGSLRQTNITSYTSEEVLAEVADFVKGLESREPAEPAIVPMHKVHTDLVDAEALRVLGWLGLSLRLRLTDLNVCLGREEGVLYCTLYDDYAAERGSFNVTPGCTAASVRKSLHEMLAAIEKPRQGSKALI